MFETPIKEFFKVVRGDSGLSALLFYLASGFAFGTLFFAVFNITGELCTNCGVPIRVDYSRFFAVPIQSLGRASPYSDAAKSVEYGMFVLLWIVFTFLVHILVKKWAVIDVLTPIRKRIVGEWMLQLEGFAADSPAPQNFNCKIVFVETEIRKLRAFYSNATHLGIKGNTSMIAITVSGDSPESSQIELSFPVISRVHYKNVPILATYWISLAHVPRVRGANIAFSGDWYKCMGPENVYQNSGSATLVYRGPHQGDAEN